jgi:hypothetical protein
MADWMASSTSSDALYRESGRTDSMIRYFARMEGKDGRDLVLEKTSVAFPKLCTRCATDQDLADETLKLTYEPWFLRLIVAIPGVNVVWYLIASAVLSSWLGWRAEYRISKCRRCARRENLITWLAVLGVFATLGLGIYYILRTEARGWMLYFTVALMIVLIVGLDRLLWMPSRVHAVYIEKRLATLRNVNPAVARALVKSAVEP